jgi:cytochrome c554/c'-like protein
MKRDWIVGGIVAGALVLLAVAGNYGSALYYAAGHGAGCADCHEMAMTVSALHGSPHSNAQCTDCHEASVGAKLRHIRAHLRGRSDETIRLREDDVRTMITNCRRCHQQEYASWHAGAHAASYGEIFTNAGHNAKRRLADDCFRCHGMYFEGGMRDLVAQNDPRGPWRLTRPELANEPAIPCLACHWVHREGPMETRQKGQASAPAIRDSLAFYDRREEMHFRAASLALPQLYDGPRPIKVSPDPRQGVCYQCHAPRQPETETLAAKNNWGPQAGSGDDRTPKGVHEGLSCMACHGGHNEDARASCANCHPAMSHCGLAVEKMDTTFADRKSAHNIHWVKCADCHQHGIPKPKTQSAALLAGK